MRVFICVHAGLGVTLKCVCADLSNPYEFISFQQVAHFKNLDRCGCGAIFLGAGRVVLPGRAHGRGQGYS